MSLSYEIIIIMIINIDVFPKTKHQSIEKKGNTYKIHLTSTPQKGKANKELLQILSDYFNVSKNQIQIVHGITSRKKIIKLNIFSEHIKHNNFNNFKSQNPDYLDQKKKHLSRIHCWDRYIGRGR